jgi:hypothetical protein
MAALAGARHAQRRQADCHADLDRDRHRGDEQLLDIAEFRRWWRRNGDRPVVADDLRQFVGLEGAGVLAAADHFRDLVRLAHLAARQGVAGFGRDAVRIGNEIPQRTVAVARQGDVDQRIAALDDIARGAVAH